MDIILKKISSYQIVNYLLPGICFVWLSDILSLIKFNQSSYTIIEKLFIYYFIGMTISRIGSIFIEKFLIYIKFIVYADYQKYMLAEKKDHKISTLLESNNNYRSFTSMMLIIILIFIYNYINQITCNNIFIFISLCITFILFLMSYKKQTAYIKKRVDLTSQTIS